MSRTIGTLNGFEGASLDNLDTSHSGVLSALWNETNMKKVVLGIEDAFRYLKRILPKPLHGFEDYLDMFCSLPELSCVQLVHAFVPTAR